MLSTETATSKGPTSIGSTYKGESTEHTMKMSSESRAISTDVPPLTTNGLRTLEDLLVACFDNATEGETTARPYRPLSFTSPSQNGQPQLSVNFKSASLESKPVKLAIAAFQQPKEGCGVDSSSSSDDSSSGGGNETSQSERSSTSSLSLNSVVNVTVYCSNGAPMQLKKGEYVDVVFPAKIDFDNEVPVCTSMARKDSSWQWTTDGCKAVYVNYTHVTCRCDHLSAIALQRGPKDYTIGGINALVLYFMEKILGATSIICLLVTVFVYLVMGSYGSQLIKVQLNIAVCIVAALMTYMLGIGATGNLFVCGALAATMQYLYTVYASLLVVQTVICFTTCYMHGKTKDSPLQILEPPKTGVLEPLNLIRIILCTWGGPAIIVAILYRKIPYGYGTTESCWLVESEIPHVVFMACNYLSFLTNALLAIATRWYIFKLESVCNARDNVDYELWVHKLKKHVKLCVASSVILSMVIVITWYIYDSLLTQPSLVRHYLFRGLNMSQGILVFVMYCLYKQEAWRVLARGLGIVTRREDDEKTK